MADIIKLVPNEDQTADEALEGSIGEFDQVLIIGWGSDGVEYRTNAPTYAEMLFLLMLGQRLIIDDSVGD